MFTPCLALIDPSVSIETKRKMIERLISEKPSVKLNQKRSLPDLSILIRHQLFDFVCKDTIKCFSRFGLSSEFLKVDPLTWDTNTDYINALDFCKNLLVVNDTAERGVRFMKSYNRMLTNDNEQNQMILQTVEAYQKKYPSYKKSCLI